MSKKETSERVSRGGKLAVAAGAAAALAVGGVAFATSATAATTPTLSITSPAQVANNNAPYPSTTKLVTLDLKNAGNDAALTIGQINVTHPSGVSCANINLSGYATFIKNPDGTTTNTGNAPTDLTGNAVNDTTCSYGLFLVAPANAEALYEYYIGVNGGGSIDNSGVVTPGVTGSLGFTATLGFPAAGGGVSNVVSNTSTTALVNPAAGVTGAPSFVSAAAPLPVVYSDTYSYQLTSNIPSGTTFKAFGSPTQPDPNNGKQYRDPITQTTTDPLTNGDEGLYLLNGYFFDTTTGKIIFDRAAANNATLPTGANNNTIDDTDVDDVVAPSYTSYDWTIIANNGVGGNLLIQPGNPNGGINKPTPAQGAHDVDSPVFTSARGFKDVSQSNIFATPIYQLTAEGAIKGFFDGTYRPGQRVTRAEFVNILVNYDPSQFGNGGLTGTGECSTLDPSAFSDVPNASPFCEAIKALSQIGVVRGSGGKFLPSNTVSRQEITAFLYRFASYEATGNIQNGDAPYTSPSPFSDVTASNVFAGDIEWAAKNNIVNGYTDGTFRPKNATTRDAAAAIIYRLQTSS